MFLAREHSGRAEPGSHTPPSPQLLAGAAALTGKQGYEKWPECARPGAPEGPARVAEAYECDKRKTVTSLVSQGRLSLLKGVQVRDDQP